MPMPAHRRLHSPSQLANGRVKAKALHVSGDVAEAALKRVTTWIDPGVSETAPVPPRPVHALSLRIA